MGLHGLEESTAKVLVPERGQVVIVQESEGAFLLQMGLGWRGQGQGSIHGASENGAGAGHVCQIKEFEKAINCFSRLEIIKPLVFAGYVPIIDLLTQPAHLGTVGRRFF